MKKSQPQEPTPPSRWGTEPSLSTQKHKIGNRLIRSRTIAASKEMKITECMSSVKIT